MLETHRVKEKKSIQKNALKEEKKKYGGKNETG